MRFLTGCLLIAFLLGAYSNLYAQTGSSGLHGKVFEEKHLPAEAATVILLAAADSSIIKSVTCDKKGAFQFQAKPGKYLLLISKIGYNNLYAGPYAIILTKEVAIDNINIRANSTQLKEISVSAQRPFVEASPGKMILNIQSSVTAQNSTIAEILGMAPGVSGDRSGGYSLIGRQGALITIDGRPTNLTGQDLTDLLQSMPGSSYQAIELNTTPSSKYESAGGGIINIISKKGTNAGTNVTANANVGFGKYYRTNAGLDFNNRMGVINIFGNYNYGENKSFHDFTTDRLINFNNILSDYKDTYKSTQLSKRHTFRVGTDIAITPNHTIGVLVSGTILNNSIDKNNTLNITHPASPDTIITTGSKTNRGQHNISYDVNYNGKLNNKGETLAADVVFNNIDRNSAEYIMNQFYNSSGGIYQNELDLQNISPANIKIWAAKIDYVNPLSKTSRLSGGIKYGKVTSNNTLIFGPKAGNVYTSDPKFSNTFIYTDNINSAYINYSNKIGKVNIAAGLRAEQTNSNGRLLTATSPVKKNYLDLFPTVGLDYQANEKNEFSISFNRNISRALYDDINPFLYYIDISDYRKGNPNLLPQYTNKIEITHVYNNTLVTVLYGSVITNFYDFVDYMQNDTTKVSTSTKTNFGTYTSLGVKFSAPVVFTTWWKGDFTLDASYQRIKSYPNPLRDNINKGSQDIIFTSRQNFRFSETFSAELSGNYESPTFYGITQNKSMYWVNTSISKQVFDKKGTISFLVYDVFNTHRDRASVNYQNLNLSIYNKDETQIVKLSFIYHFGNISLKGIMKHNVSNEEEQNRAGGVAGTVPTN